MAKTSLPDVPSADTDEWVAAEGAMGDRLSLLRFRPGLKRFLGDPRFSRRLQVTWSFDDDGGSGMPSEEDSDAMRPLEDRLVGALEVDGAGVLAFVFTHAGRREWHFYVSASADLGAIVNEALEDMPGLPIEIALEDDPDWGELGAVLDSVGE